MKDRLQEGHVPGERPPRLPRWPREVQPYATRLWPAILAANRPRPMGSVRTVRHPDGRPVAEEAVLSFRVPTPDLVRKLAEALDVAIRLDAAAWAGYDGFAMKDGDRAVLSWPRWIELEVFWERR